MWLVQLMLFSSVFGVLGGLAWHIFDTWMEGRQAEKIREME
jgi:hypothetical protein